MKKCCSNPKIFQDATGAAEIRGDTYQWCWLACANCGAETEPLESINADPSVWSELEKLDLTLVAE